MAWPSITQEYNDIMLYASSQSKLIRQSPSSCKQDAEYCSCRLELTLKYRFWWVESSWEWRVRTTWLCNEDTRCIFNMPLQVVLGCASTRSICLRFWPASQTFTRTGTSDALSLLNDSLCQPSSSPLWIRLTLQGRWICPEEIFSLWNNGPQITGCLLFRDNYTHVLTFPSSVRRRG